MDAVMRNLEIIGEAVNRLPEEFKDGYFVKPTIIVGVPPSKCRLQQEEIFGRRPES